MRGAEQFLCGLSRWRFHPVYLRRFQFNTEQSYMLEFTAGLIRFITAGAYVLEANWAIGASVYGGPLTLTIPGAGWAVGDQVYFAGVVGLDRANGINGLDGRTLQVDFAAGDTYTFIDPVQNLFVITDGWTPFQYGVAARIYSVPSPYAAADLFALKFTQSADILDIAHVNYPPMQLKRMAAASWSLAPLPIAAIIQAPQGVLFQAIGGPGGSDSVLRYNYCVTSVDNKTGEESTISDWVGGPNNTLNQVTGIENIISWNAVAGAVGYRVYKTVPVLNGTVL
jgi:hypothetical protein